MRKCLGCRYMACKQFFHKTEVWTGFCLNPKSPRNHTNICGTDKCDFFDCDNKLEMELFDTESN